MRARPLLLAASFATAMVAGGACSSFEAGGPVVDGGSDAGPEAATLSDAESDTSTSEAGDGGLSEGITVLAAGFADLSGVTATETTVYFLERGPGIVHSVPLAGGAATALETTGGSPSSIGVTSSHLVWADHGKETLSRRPHATGVTVTVTPTPGKTPAAMAVTEDRIVLAALGPANIGEIQQYDYDFAAGPSIGGQLNPFDVAVSNGVVFWTESQTGAIRSAPIGSAATTQVTMGESDCQSIAADAEGVYWTRPSESLVRARLGTGVNGTINLATAQKSPLALAADASGVYWLTADGKLRRSTRTETPIQTLAQGFKGGFVEQHIQALALTNEYVVWITTDGKVLRHAK